ncbi:MAG: electron transport complex subunit RsxB [Pseudomonadota bacterium]
MTEVLLAIGIIALIAMIAGVALSVAARSLPGDANSVVQNIDALLPQTQCAQCGYAGCRPYAEAIAAHEAPINRCPPGGDATILALAKLLNRDTMALDSTLEPVTVDSVAVIDESQCIGCARCLPACPVDAIVGAHPFTHTVVSDLCTGCELCIAPCPVDCISMVATQQVTR